MERNQEKMQYQKHSDQLDQLISLFIDNGCSTKLTLSFITNNLDYILKDENIMNKIYFICNNTEIYAILIVDDNNYSWSICQDNISYPLEKKGDENSDYVIEKIINYANEKKFKKVIPNSSKMNTETKIKTLRNIKLNSNGYHIQ